METEGIIGLSIFIFFVGLIMGIQIVGWNALGNECVTVESLDNVCSIHYGEGYNWYNTAWLTETNISCRKVNVDSIKTFV